MDSANESVRPDRSAPKMVSYAIWSRRFCAACVIAFQGATLYACGTESPGATGVPPVCPGDPDCYSGQEGDPCGPSIASYCGSAPGGRSYYCYRYPGFCGLGTCQLAPPYTPSTCGDGNLDPVLGCDGVMFENVCQMEQDGHESSYYRYPSPPCPKVPSSCDSLVGEILACAIYGHCGMRAAYGCHSLPNGQVQVDCDPPG